MPGCPVLVGGMKSILQSDRVCYICGRPFGLEMHHILGGTANRKLSEKYGLKVWLCHRHHTGEDGAQYDPHLNKLLKMDAQTAFERTHTHAEWMRIFGKNYL